MIKKSTYLICSVLMCLLCVGNVVCYADSGYDASNYTVVDYGITVDKVEQTLLQFVYGQDAIDNGLFDDSGARVNRTAGSEEEKACSEYLYTQLKAIIEAKDSSIEEDKAYLEDEANDRNTINEIMTQSFNFNSNYKSYTSQNIVGLIKSTKIVTSKFIVIGAHYDNYYNYATDIFASSTAKSHGIYDNASGVSALLEITKVMQQHRADIDYNVLIAFYGAEEMGYCGSEYLYNTIANKKNLLFAVNLDSIGAGDKMYMYADEVSTLHQDYFKALADQQYKQDSTNNVYFNLPPKNKKVGYITGGGALGYSHMGLASDNATYVANGVNVITFFSGNWDDDSRFGITESSKNGNITHTKKDNITTVMDMYGEVFYKRIASTSNLVVNALLKDDFVDVINKSNTRSRAHLFFLNPTFIKIILVSIIVIVMIVVMIVMKKHRPALDPQIEKLKQAVINNDLSTVESEQDALNNLNQDGYTLESVKDVDVKNEDKVNTDKTANVDENDKDNGTDKEDKK